MKLRLGTETLEIPDSVWARLQDKADREGVRVRTLVQAAVLKAADGGADRDAATTRSKTAKTAVA